MSQSADGRALQRISRRRRASALEADLRAALAGEVRFDEAYRAAYSCDSSNYRQVPIGVVCPRDADDVLAALAACRAHRAPVTFRGAGTSLAGQTTNAAVIVDTSRHMRAILEVDAERRLARVQPGVTRDQLAKPLEAEHGLSFPPDTSTHAYATFGGMIANNSCGAHSVMTGRTSDNLAALEVALYDGTRLRVGPTSDEELERIVAAGGRRGEIYRALADLRDRYADLIRARYPKIPRRVSGYNLDELLPENGFHVARALAGSEGTLCATLEATLHLHPWPAARTLLILGYPSIFEAADHVPEVMAQGPMACEAIDDVLIEDMVKQGLHEHEVPMLPEGKGWLIVEFGADTREEADEKARAARDALRPPSSQMYDDPGDEERLWKVREGGLGATAYLPGARDHYEGWEDAAVPPENLGAYLRDFQALLDRYGYDTSKYGHMGQGLTHCRINFGLRFAGGLQQWRAFMDEVTSLVVRHGGVFSGEHGDGQSKAQFLDKLYGPELLQAFRELKAIWDPDGRMNPHKVVEPYRIDENLKLGTSYDPPHVRTHFHYPEDGGSFAHASAPASAATRPRARCARATWPRWTRSTRRAGARESCSRCCAARRSRAAFAPTRCTRRSTCACRARAARATARSTSTWPPTRPSSWPSTTSAACARVRPTAWAWSCSMRAWPRACRGWSTRSRTRRASAPRSSARAESLRRATCPGSRARPSASGSPPARSSTRTRRRSCCSRTRSTTSCTPSR